MNSNSKNSRQKNATLLKNTQPLLRLPEARVQIFSDCIKAQGVYMLQASTADTGEFASINDLPKLDELSKQKGRQYKSTRDNFQADECKIIMFNNPDFAFNILEHINIVEIHDLAHNTIPLKFKVNSTQNLLTVQSLLRRKMCELGFQSKYKIIKQLGKGATAEVHLVMRLSDKKYFAAKIISIKDANDKAYQTFINESKLLRMLRHKNIIHLQSLYIHKKQLIQLMQYLNGGTLLQLIKEDKLQSRKQKWTVLRDITLALEYLRERRIVHRDLKLENILIRQNGQQYQFVLSDFGLASWTGEKNPLFQRCGTPGYIAPEVLNAPKGKPVLDHKADIFSLGIIAHILFLHQPLFYYSGNVKQLLKLNKKAEYSLESSLYRNLSLSQSTFLQMTLAKNPEQRAAAAAILDQLKYPLNSFSEATPQKSARQKLHSKISVDSHKLGIQVEVKKPASLTKTKINLKSDKKLQRAPHSTEKPQKSEEKRSISNSARKLFSDVWSSLSTPKKQKLKIKQNSVQKHKKLIQYFQ